MLSTTTTGLLLEKMVPSPSFPSLFAPQHAVLSVEVVAQVWDQPALMEVKATVMVTTAS
jgi:hypothetical protein